MTDSDIRTEDLVRQQAIDQADRYVRRHGCPRQLQSTQIAGLRQISLNEPRHVGPYALKQKQRADKRHQEELAAFWELVNDLCTSQSKNVSWSLAQLRKQQSPATQSRAEQQTWEAEWTARHVPLFFRVFCIHYLYLLSTTT